MAKHTQSTQNNKVSVSLQCLKEDVKDEVVFLPTDKDQKFLQIHTIILGLCGQKCPKYQNNKFAISLQYLENVKDEVDFLPADKRQRFVQINTIILGLCDQTYSSYPKLQVCYFFPIS